MAHLLPNFEFTGSLRKVSAYKMRGVEGLVLRTKGGPTKQQIKTSKRFDLVRRHNAEFGGRSVAGRWMRYVLAPLRSLSNYNISAFIPPLLMPAQEADTEREFGQRSVLLSKNPRILEGFSYNRGVLFDSIVRNPISVQLNREELSARLDMPALIPGINFYVPGNYAAYSITTVLGVIPDFHFDGNRYNEPEQYRQVHVIAKEHGSEWHPCGTGSPTTIVELKIPNPMPDNAFSLVLGIGIRFGTLGLNNSIEQIKRTGAAKILAMG